MKCPIPDNATIIKNLVEWVSRKKIREREDEEDRRNGIIPNSFEQTYGYRIVMLPGGTGEARATRGNVTIKRRFLF